MLKLYRVVIAQFGLQFASRTNVLQSTIERRLPVLQAVNSLSYLKILSRYLIISPVPLYHCIVDSLCVYVLPLHIYTRKSNLSTFAQRGIWLIIVLQFLMEFLNVILVCLDVPDPFKCISQVMLICFYGYR